MDNYLETIIQYLLRIVNKISSSDENVNNKLDEVVQAVSNIKIQAESVNLNTDEVENKLDILNKSILDNLKNIHNSQLYKGFVQPTHIAPVVSGDTTFTQNVVLCNITNDYLTTTVIAKDDDTAQSIVLAPGWNPVIIKSVIGVIDNTLIYGY